MPQALGTINTTTDVLITGDGGLAAFSSFEEAADRAVNTTESDFVTLSALDFPDTKDGVNEYRIDIPLSHATGSVANFIRIRLYMGVNGTSADTEQEQWVYATNTSSGVSRMASVILTPGASDLIGLSHQTGSGTSTVFGAGGADARTTRLFITRVS